uniref:Putative ovule protein n=1 Tax=Solanum chacoense TaxID=4108 RepID=A0A0V0GJ58_SOLCH
MAQLLEKVVAGAAPLAGETTNTISLTSLHLYRTPSPFFFLPSPTSTNPETLIRRTSSSPLTIIDRYEPLPTAANH